MAIQKSDIGKALPHLEWLVAEADPTADFHPHDWGFLLYNGQLRLEYKRICRIYCLDVTFDQNYTEGVMFGLRAIGYSPNTSEERRCDVISASCTGDTLALFRQPTAGQQGGDPGWFDDGTRIMDLAAQRYGVERYCRRHHDLLSPVRRFLRKLDHELQVALP